MTPVHHTRNSNLKVKKNPYDMHYRFHQILGHVTTIRVAIWQLKQGSQISDEDRAAAQVAEAHIDKLVDEIEQLKQQCYNLID